MVTSGGKTTSTKAALARQKNVFSMTHEETAHRWGCRINLHTMLTTRAETVIQSISYLTEINILQFDWANIYGVIYQAKRPNSTIYLCHIAEKNMLRFGVFDCKVECYSEPFDRLVDHQLLTFWTECFHFIILKQNSSDIYNFYTSSDTEHYQPIWR